MVEQSGARVNPAEQWSILTHAEMEARRALLPTPARAELARAPAKAVSFGFGICFGGSVAALAPRSGYSSPRMAFN